MSQLHEHLHDLEGWLKDVRLPKIDRIRAERIIRRMKLLDKKGRPG